MCIRDRDFFCVASFDEPHGPYLCPKKYVDMYADYKLPRPGNFDDTLEDKPEFQRLWARPFRHLTEDPEFRASHKEFFGCNTSVSYTHLPAAAVY